MGTVENYSYVSDIADARRQGAEEFRKAALEKLQLLYMAEREKVNRAVERNDDESYRLHKRRGDGFFEAAQAIETLPLTPENTDD